MMIMMIALMFLLWFYVVVLHWKWV